MESVLGYFRADCIGAGHNVSSGNIIICVARCTTLEFSQKYCIIFDIITKHSRIMP
jgi:hypothetical protein